MVKNKKPDTSVDDPFAQLLQALEEKYRPLMTSAMSDIQPNKAGRFKGNQLSFSGADRQQTEQLRVALGCLTALTTLARTDNTELSAAAIAARDKLLEALTKSPITTTKFTHSRN